MPYPNLDALFYMSSQGDKEAFKTLQKQFERKISYSVYLERFKMVTNSQIPQDFNIFVDDLFVKAVNDYDPNRGSFSWFTKIFLELKISNKINEPSLKNKVEIYSLDNVDDEGRREIDQISDDSCGSMCSEIAVNNFKYMISSPNNKLNKEERIRNKVLMMKYAGYTDLEISKALKVSLGILRGIIKKYNEDDYVINFKMELK